MKAPRSARTAASSGAEARFRASPRRLAAGPLALDLLVREGTRSGQPLGLQPRAFRLLEYLMRNAGRVVSKTLVIEHVCGYDFGPQTNVVDVLVHRLRKKVDEPFETRMIETGRGASYVIRLPEADGDAGDAA